MDGVQKPVEFTVDGLFKSEMLKAICLNITYEGMLNNEGMDAIQVRFRNAKLANGQPLPVPSLEAIKMLREYIVRTNSMFPDKLAKIRDYLMSKAPQKK